MERKILLRRKLFLFVIMIIFAIVIFYYSDVSLIHDNLEEYRDKEVSYEGEIVSIESYDEEKISFVINVNKADGKEIKGRSNVLINLYESDIQPWQIFKAFVKFECTVNTPEAASNPGCFDYRKHLLSRGITGKGSIKEIYIEESSSGLINNLQQRLLKARYSFSLSVSEESRGILMGLLFGETDFLDEDIYEEFRNNGTAHILAVSGLHVGILYIWIKKLIGKRKSLLSLAVVAMILFTYCFLSMWSISAVRASCMIIMAVYASYRDRRYDMLTAGSFIALIMIVQNPYVVFNTGFQMSFIAVTSVAFFLKRMPSGIPDSIAVMISVNLGLCLYQIYVFNYFSLSSFAANIPVVYLAGIIVPFSLLRFITYYVLGNVEFLEIITDSLAYVIMRINEIMSFDGKISWDITSPPLWMVILLYICLFFLASEYFEIMCLRGQFKKICLIICCAAAFAAFIGIKSHEPISYDDLVFVNVGQGDCLHIKTGNKNIMIDGGGKIDYNVGKKILKPYLLKNRVSNVDLAIATHLHTDHFKGLKELQEEGMIKNMKSGIAAGKTFSVSEDVKIETLWPLTLEGDEIQDENDNCSVFMVYFNNFKILVTGDLDEAGERKMIEFYGKEEKLKADILKVGHHGSKTSTSDEFLNAVSPEYAVIQVGKNNYGHPDIKIIEKCRKRGIIVLRNDTHGAVGFSFKEGKIQHHEMMENNL